MSSHDRSYFSRCSSVSVAAPPSPPSCTSSPAPSRTASRHRSSGRWRSRGFRRRWGVTSPPVRTDRGCVRIPPSAPKLLITPIFPEFSRFFPVFPGTSGRVLWIPGVQTLKMGEKWGKMGKKWVKNGITGLQKTALMHASAHLSSSLRSSSSCLASCVRKAFRPSTVFRNSFPSFISVSAGRQSARVSSDEGTYLGDSKGSEAHPRSCVA